MTNLKRVTKFLLGATALSTVSVGAAHAAGTDAGTSVANTFSLNYDVGGVAQPEISTCDGGTGCAVDTSTRFTVDRKIDLTVASLGDVNVVPGAQDQNLVFTVTNTGNDNQAYGLTSPINEPGDDYNATLGAGNNVYIFPAGAGGVCTLAGNLIAANEYAGAPAATFDVAPDGVMCVVVQGDIQSTGVVDTDEAEVTLVADTLQPTAYINSAAPTPGAEEVADSDALNALTGSAENVLADGSGTSNEAATSGDHSSTGTYIITAADLTGAKTVNVISTDGTGCSTVPTSPTPPTTTQYSIPGACVEYVIEVANNGATVAADFIDVGDTVSADLENVVANYGVFTDTDATNTVAVNVVGNQVDLTNGKLAAGQTGYLIIRATVK